MKLSRLNGVVILGWVRKYGANVNFARTALQDGRGQFLLRGKALVANVNFLARYRFNGKGELSSRKDARVLGAVAEPLVHK